MIAAERDEMLDRPRLRLDRRQRPLNVAMGDPEIADIGDVGLGRRAAGDRMVAIDQHAAGLPDRGRPEPRARTVRGAEVIRNPGDADRRAGVAALEPEKARARRKSRNGSHAVEYGDAASGFSRLCHARVPYFCLHRLNGVLYNIF